MIMHAQKVLTLWVTTHAAADFCLHVGLPRPFSCQLCLAGWSQILFAFIAIVVFSNVEAAWWAMTYWALAVLLEAVYQRLHTITL